MTLPDETPDLHFGPLRIWIHGQRFQEGDSWDLAWLHLTAHCGEQGASVVIEGAYLQTDSIHRWRNELRTVHADLGGTATLQAYEPNLRVTVSGLGGTGAMFVGVAITPDHRTQKHSFEFMVDQTFLPPLIDQCERVLGRYPVRASSEFGS